MKSGTQLIAEERQRQIEVEKWDNKHDADYKEGEMMGAAGCYIANALSKHRESVNHTNQSPLAKFQIYDFGELDFLVNSGDRGDRSIRKAGWRDGWPWSIEWDKRKKHDIQRSLVIAGALIAAELDKINNVAAASPLESVVDTDTKLCELINEFDNQDPNRNYTAQEVVNYAVELLGKASDAPIAVEGKSKEDVDDPYDAPRKVWVERIATDLPEAHPNPTCYSIDVCGIKEDGTMVICFFDFETHCWLKSDNGNAIPPPVYYLVALSQFRTQPSNKEVEIGLLKNDGLVADIMEAYPNAPIVQEVEDMAEAWVDEPTEPGCYYLLLYFTRE